MEETNGLRAESVLKRNIRFEIGERLRWNPSKLVEARFSAEIIWILQGGLLVLQRPRDHHLYREIRRSQRDVLKGIGLALAKQQRPVVVACN